MKSLLRVLLVTGVLMLLTASVAFAAGSMTLKAMGTASGKTTLNWTIASGDSLEYSLDGIAWSTIAAGGATGVRTTAVLTGNDAVLGLTDYTNYYFRVKHADGTYSAVADAFPPNEHAHRYFAADTNMCAKCHGTHTAVGYHLVKAVTVDAMCNTCHAGTGAKYQVDDGTAATATTPIAALGGPFGNQLGTGSSVIPTSSHKLGATLTTAPGGDTGNANGKWSAALGCASCHSAHSAINYQYRLLKNSLPYMPIDPATGAAITSINVEAYAVTAAGKELGVYVKGMNTFCGGCHADYDTTNVSAAAHNKSHVFGPDFYRHQVGYDIAEFRHGVGLTSTLPLEATADGAFVSDGTRRTEGEIACITCHKPHGVTTVSQGSSSLLIMSNRGVCQDCHQK